MHPKIAEQWKIAEFHEMYMILVAWCVSFFHSQGVYVYDQISKQGRRLINIVDMSHTVSDSVQQIIRGTPPYDQILWQKVSEGMIP